MKTLPEPNEMFRALVERDTSYDGSFFAAVKTTGIFCRPGCGAKKPRRENVEFFADATAAARAGFRPCRRCRPLEPAGAAPPWVSQLLARMRREPSARLRSTDLRNLGIEPARATRWFRSRYGVTFQEYQRNRTLGRALVRVRRGESVTRAALESGFESESGFRDAFTRLFGAPPTRAARDGDVVRIHWISTPIGSLLVGAHAGGICFCEFLDRRALPRQIETLRRRAGRPVLPGRNAHLERLESELANYFSGRSLGFTAPIDAPGTPFQEAVWRELRAIPAGETRSYADLARALGRPGAVRAVARANGDNRIAILIPCHRVIGSDGSLTGYGGGLWRKQWLLEHERESARAGET
jgi:AraC family transcriptional regulator of adaptative response/methylated-DNA-[protein]-cysteine methyltransferase